MTAPAVGVHASSTMKLGLRPPDRSKPRLRLANFLTGVVPAHPASADYLAGLQFGLYGNDRYGDCGPVSVANSRREVTARLSGRMVAPTQDDVFDLYRRSGNPQFDPATGADDNGVNMQEMLGAVQRGGIGGTRCLGFAQVDTSNLDEMQAAVAVFGFLLLGVTLEAAQQSQTQSGVWDYRPSGMWGGHAILGGAYASSPAELEVITWAQHVKMTSAFMRHQLSEAWAVVWPEHLTDHGFLQGVDLRAFAAAWEAVTGLPFPAPVPPPPPPPPPPPSGSRTIVVTGGTITIDGKPA